MRCRALLVAFLCICIAYGVNIEREKCSNKESRQCLIISGVDNVHRKFYDYYEVPLKFFHNQWKQNVLQPIFVQKDDKSPWLGYTMADSGLEFVQNDAFNGEEVKGNNEKLNIAQIIEAIKGKRVALKRNLYSFSAYVIRDIDDTKKNFYGDPDPSYGVLEHAHQNDYELDISPLRLTSVDGAWQLSHCLVFHVGTMIENNPDKDVPKTNIIYFMGYGDGSSWKRDADMMSHVYPQLTTTELTLKVGRTIYWSELGNGELFAYKIGKTSDGNKVLLQPVDEERDTLEYTQKKWAFELLERHWFFTGEGKNKGKLYGIGGIRIRNDGRAKDYGMKLRSKDKKKNKAQNAARRYSGDDAYAQELTDENYWTDLYDENLQRFSRLLNLGIH